MGKWKVAREESEKWNINGDHTYQELRHPFVPARLG
jgi:hypothetical protein